MTGYQEALNELQDDVGDWSDENFGDQSAVNPLLGSIEELGELNEAVVETGTGDSPAPRSITTMIVMAQFGELTHSILKRRQGIRLDEDEVGDYPEQQRGHDMMDLLDWLQRADSYDGNLDDLLGEPDYDEEMDAVGDVLIYLADFCHRRGYNLGDAAALAWEGEVKDREWDSHYTDEH